MHDPLPAPEFDRTKYERPNQDWVCGRTCEGKPCTLGPTPNGRCRSTAECRPALESGPGGTKGRWKCTRSKLAGGPCELGPGPEGQCGCPIIPCVPQSSLRHLRGRVTWAVIAVTVGMLVVLVAGPWRWKFISPGVVSQNHRNPGFDTNAMSQMGSSGCAGCHDAASGGIRQWLLGAYTNEPGPLEWRKLAQANPGQHTRMDEKHCLACHQNYQRHQPNVVAAHSCSDCHREHQGDRMAAPKDAACASCHDNRTRINQFTRKADLNPRDFHAPLAAGLLAFVTPRPVGVQLAVFGQYWEGHPDFGLHIARLAETNTLKFNHQLHLGPTVQKGGVVADEAGRLSCWDCHQPDTTGAYFSRIRFDQHCQTCHSLQFDPVNPEMKLPHGNPGAVRSTVASLATLQTQYADLARRRGLTDRARIDDFARTNASLVKKLLGTGEQLVDLILFTGDPRARMLPENQEAAGKRAHYAGCAYCHEVTRDLSQQPVVTRPQIPDRWLPGGRFNHARHAQTSCIECHGTVLRSSSTADINLPHQTVAGIPAEDRTAGAKACVDCHHPGDAPTTCATCHTYHMLKPL